MRGAQSCYGRRVSEKPRSKPKSSDAAPKKGKDVVLIHGVSADGDSLAVLRARDNRVEAGIVRAVKEGEVGQGEGELVRLAPRPDCPLVCDVEVELPKNTLNAKGGSDHRAALPSSSAPHHGPAQVATPIYRENWDAIWSGSASSKKALPN